MAEVNTGRINLIAQLKEQEMVFKIPPFQRSYTWDLDIIQELWNDILENAVNPNSAVEHFIGVFIFAKEEEKSSKTKSRLVIDGQQRLTSFTILLRAMHDHISDGYIKNRIYDAIVGGDVGKSAYPRLELGDDARVFFRKYIQERDANSFRRTNKKGRRKVEKRIIAAYKFFAEHIPKEAQSRKMTADKFIELLFERLEQRVIAVKIDVDSDTDAYTVFETINSKKVELSVSELLKNYLFQQSDRLGDTELENTKKRWQEIIDNLSTDETEPSQYIRHFWISNVENVTDKKLYLAIKTYCKGHDKKLKELVRSLAEQSVQYGNIVSANKEDDDKVIDDDAILLLAQIRSLRIKQCYPLLLSAVSIGLSKGQFRALLKAVIRASLTRSLTDKNPNELERMYEKNAFLLRTKGTAHLGQTLKDINSLASVEKELVEYLTQPDSSVSEQIAKFLLIQAELKVRTEETTLNRVSLEHLLPRTPDDFSAWGITKDEHEKWVGKLGNLLLVGTKLNSQASNKQYSEKKKILIKSDIKTTKALVKVKNKWGTKDITTRTKELAKFAITNWA